MTPTAPGGHPFFCAHRAQVVAHGAWLFPVEFCRERAAANAGAIGLGDSQDVVQHARPHTGTRSSIAGHAVAGRDKGVSAVVHVEQGALRAFKQQISPCAVSVVELARDVSHHGLEQLGVAHGLVVNGVKVDCRRI